MTIGRAQQARQTCPRLLGHDEHHRPDRRRPRYRSNRLISRARSLATAVFCGESTTQSAGGDAPSISSSTRVRMAVPPDRLPWAMALATARTWFARPSHTTAWGPFSPLGRSSGSREMRSLPRGGGELVSRGASSVIRTGRVRVVVHGFPSWDWDDRTASQRRSPAGETDAYQRSRRPPPSPPRPPPPPPRFARGLATLTLRDRPWRS